ncbi:hypothetical protein [Methylocystis parvus]|uniref:Uncharacterized protein n=1 Tax=Methylocystis parvus TaxID=134 RepID=A0A6B8MAV6_9HYPH|nr:hypothetical protein [Methylocystis parvus]QGM97790.1 hypothetical protein F7D14_10130 [Methylocystis parvus]WBK02174.1 hypothetical protein MMG94_09460 [Methylocystis parvus OBBP]
MRRPAILLAFTLILAPSPAFAEDDVTAREAFGIAKELGTAEAWEAYLKRFPNGFHADVARGYLKKLGREVEADAPVAARAAVAGKLGPNADLEGASLVPKDSFWRQDISGAPVDRNSARILARIGDKPLHPDFGAVWEGAPIGIPYVVVDGAQKRTPVVFTYAEESDPGPYPIPPDAPIEGGAKADGDRHVIVLDRDNSMLYELFNAFPQRDGSWKADSGAIWNLAKSNQTRPAGWTSADAAGLPILPGLVRYDEVVGAGAVEHALRFTLSKTRRAYTPPASHWASDATDPALPPMGMRVRLKANYDISKFHPQVQTILKALKTYGMALADNGGDNFVSGAPDPRWDPDVLRQLKRVTTKDMEVVEMKTIVTGDK